MIVTIRVVKRRLQEEAVKVKIQAPKEPMIYLMTADTDSEVIHFREWLETIIKDK